MCIHFLLIQFSDLRRKNFSHLLNINKLHVFNLNRILDLLGFLQEFYMVSELD
jgi:hypothetical protein